MMKVVILAGGYGTRISEESHLIPKPMIEIGGKPMLWHIMNYYAAHGLNEFIIAAGYKAEYIKNYFLNYYAINNDISIDLINNKTTIYDGKQPNWKIHILDTGLGTQTGGRIKRVKKMLEGEENFMIAYGDGLIDMNMTDFMKFHNSHGKLASVTAVRPPARFGRISIDGFKVCEFNEKPDMDQGWINGGFFIVNKKVIDYIDGDQTVWEREPIERIAREDQLMCYQHQGFWSCMDTLKEKNIIEEYWNSGKAPWKIW
jgi:glucose-1-phosphate cytidylyltransferase